MSETTRTITSWSPAATLRRNRPPIASERGQILTLIQEDHELIGYLSDKASQRLIAATQAVTLVEERRIALADAEQRLETATSLYEFFIKNNKTPSIPDNGPPSSRSTSSVSTGQRQQFDSLMAIADTYIQSTRAVVEQAALAVQEARDSVSLQRDELQAALTISMMHHECHTLLIGQIASLKRAIMQMEVAFRAIWRVPREIWRMIFEEVIGEDEEELSLSSMEGSWAGLRRDGCETLRLSGVCHNWRSLVHSTPSLWNHICIKSATPHHIDRIHHYYNLCDRSRLTFTVISATTRDSRCYRPLHHSFYSGTPCKKITLLIRAPGVPALNYLLPFLPPPTELSILRHPPTGELEELERTPAPIIPRSFCGTIRKLDISAAGAQWTDESAMRLEKYYIVAPPVSAIFGPHLFIPSSLHSLTSIGIQGRLFNKEVPSLANRRPLPNVTETIMDLNFLVTVFTRHYTVPAVQRLVIPAGSSVTPEEWRTFLTEVEHTSGRITDVCCLSFDNEIGPLARCLASLRHLSRLELHGESVDRTLEILACKLEQDPSILPSLQFLVLQSYIGDADTVVSFLNALRCREAHAHVPKMRVALRACQGMAVDMVRILREQAELVV